MQKRLWSLAIASVVLMTTATQVDAAGFGIKEQSSSYLGSAYAGTTAGTEDASVMFFNPAGIAQLKGHQLVFGGSYIAPVSDVQSAIAVSGGFGVPSTVDDGDIAQDAFVPVFYALYDYSPKINYGISLTAPWGLVTDYDGNSEFRYNGLTSNLQTINVTPTMSYKVSDRLSLGVGAQIQYASARLTKAINCGALIAAPFARDCIVDNTLDDLSAGVTIGAQWQAEKTRFGVSYRSKVVHNADGDAKVELPSGITAGQQAALRALFPETQSMQGKLATPAMWNFGVEYDVNSKWTVMADTVWTGWSEFSELTLRYDTGLGGSSSSTVPENWEDVWFYTIGAKYQWDDKTALRFGVAYDETPILDGFRTERIPGEDRYWLAFGGQYILSEKMTLDFGYAHIFMDNAKIQLPERGSDPSLNASYKEKIDILSAQIQYKF